MTTGRALCLPRKHIILASGAAPIMLKLFVLLGLGLRGTLQCSRECRFWRIAGWTRIELLENAGGAHGTSPISFALGFILIWLLICRGRALPRPMTDVTAFMTRSTDVLIGSWDSLSQFRSFCRFWRRRRLIPFDNGITQCLLRGT